MLPEDKEGEKLQELIGNSRYIPFLHRLQESYLSMIVNQLEEDQKLAVAKVLEVYTQAILSSLKLRNYHSNLKEKYDIIAAQEEVSVTFDPGRDSI